MDGKYAYNDIAYTAYATEDIAFDNHLEVTEDLAIYNIIKNNEVFPAGTWELYPPFLQPHEGHYYAECSAKGQCDRSSGECKCYDGHEGVACQRVSCPNDCSGHGVCRSVGYLAARGTADSDPTTPAEPHAYSQWDGDKIFTCDCDEGYYWADCSQKRCPLGTDPLFAPEFAKTYPTQLVSYKLNTVANNADYAAGAKKSWTYTFLIADFPKTIKLVDDLGTTTFSNLYVLLADGTRVYLDLASTPEDVAEAVGNAMDANKGYPSQNDLTVKIAIDDANDVGTCETIGACANDDVRWDTAAAFSIKISRQQVGASDNLGAMVVETQEVEGEPVIYKSIAAVVAAGAGGAGTGTVSLTLFDPRGRAHEMRFGIDEGLSNTNCGDVDTTTDMCDDCGVRAALQRVVDVVPEFAGATVSCFGDAAVGFEETHYGAVGATDGATRSYIYLEFPNFYGELKTIECGPGDWLDSAAPADQGAYPPEYRHALEDDKDATSFYHTDGGFPHGVTCTLAASYFVPVAKFHQSLVYPTKSDASAFRSRAGQNFDNLLNTGTMGISWLLSGPFGVFTFEKAVFPKSLKYGQDFDEKLQWRNRQWRTGPGAVDDNGHAIKFECKQAGADADQWVFTVGRMQVALQGSDTGVQMLAKFNEAAGLQADLYPELEDGTAFEWSLITDDWGTGTAEDSDKLSDFCVVPTKYDDGSDLVHNVWTLYSNQVEQDVPPVEETSGDWVRSVVPLLKSNPFIRVNGTDIEIMYITSDK